MDVQLANKNLFFLLIYRYFIKLLKLNEEEKLSVFISLINLSNKK